jgi:hypothetical protein
VPPQSLSISREGDDVLISWSTNNAGFVLQSVTNVASANWVTVTNEPTLVNDRFTVTIGLSEAAKYFRLRN